MSETEEEPRRASRTGKARSSGSSARYLYGALLVAIGGCLGIVIGSVSDTPRILFDRLRGPVETVDLESPAPPSAAAPAAPPLEAFSELQGAPAAKSKPPEPAKPEPAKAEPAKPEPPKTTAKAEPKPAPPAAPPVSSAPPPAAPAPAKSPDQIVRELEKKAATGTVVQVLSLADKKQADAMMARLKAQGFDSYASAMPDKSGRLRVRVRPKSSETTAALEVRLRQLGFKTWITAE